MRLLCTDTPNTRVLLPAYGGVFGGARTASGLACVSPVQVVVDLAHEPERAAEFGAALREALLARALAMAPPADL